MSSRFRSKNFLLSSLLSAFFLLPASCFYTLDLNQTYPLKIDPKVHQPVAFFPIPDAPGQPESGSNLYSFIRDSLEKKGYSLVRQDKVSEILEEMELPPLLLLSDQESLLKIGERLKAKLLIIGTIPEYKVQKAYLGTQTFKVWDRESDDYLTLPTYHQGASQIRLILTMFEAEKGSLVWMAEGSIHAPSDSPGVYGDKLAESLLKSLPSISPLPKEKSP